MEGKYLTIEGGGGLFPTMKAENSRFSLKQGGGLFRGGGAVPVDFYCKYLKFSHNFKVITK